MGKLLQPMDRRSLTHILLPSCLWAVLWMCSLAAVRPAAFVNFETAPVHPIDLGPDGRTVALCNLPDNRVQLFDVSQALPVPGGDVVVGLDPVTVRFASSNELWVVNHISSTLSIVDVAARAVVATIDTPAGPSDLVFAGAPRRAWISCARTNSVFVVDVATRAAVTNIAIDGERPRAMAASPDGSRVYVAIFESGNGTTVIGPKLTHVSSAPQPGPIEEASGPYGGANPPPNVGIDFVPAINVSNAIPRVSHIVRRNAEGRWLDDNNSDWTEWVSGTNAGASGRIEGWDLPDKDLAIIDTTTLEVNYAQRVMNICMALGVNPASGEVAMVGTDALNERRFEPVLNGVFLRVNLALIDPNAKTNRIRDLNPHLDYSVRTLPQSQRAFSIGDPRGIEWNSNGTRAYITGMGSRNLIVINANGSRLNAHPIELGEGPTGMALDEARSRLYVWNRFSSSISVVDTTVGILLTNVPVFDPTPEIVRKGRRHLYDTRKTSGLGIASCASCHVDARGDRLAWDLGNPAGTLVTNFGFAFHPMKGPMVTQTLQDIITPTNFNGQAMVQQPLHWRGDRNGLEEFNATFTNLQGNDLELTPTEMAEFKGMLATIFFPPNPLRTFSNSLPAALALPGHFTRTTTNGGPRQPLPVGNPQRGLTRFASSECRLCHDFNQGRNIIVDELLDSQRNGNQGPFKSAQFRSVAEKIGMDGQSTNSRAGFGFMHDGRVDTLTRFLVDGFPEVVPHDQAVADLIAFLMCFTGSDLTTNPSGPSQDVPAATGRQITIASPSAPLLLNEMLTLAGRTNSRVELILRGKQNGHSRGWLYRRGTQDFQSDRHGEIAPGLANVIASASSGNEFTATLVPEGTGVRRALDRDGDGYFDRSEIETGFDPAEPNSHPGLIVSTAKAEDEVTLTWQSAPGATYAIEYSTNLSSSWKPLVPPFVTSTSLTTNTHALPQGEPIRFYRIRMEP